LGVFWWLNRNRRRSSSRSSSGTSFSRAFFRPTRMGCTRINSCRRICWRSNRTRRRKLYRWSFRRYV